MKANREYLAAEKLLEFSEDDSLTEAICLHSGESVRKFIKSYSVLNEIQIDQADSLTDIISKYKEGDSDFGNIKIGNISNYIDKIWAPEDNLPTLKEAHEAFRTAQSVRKFILDKLHLSAKDLQQS